MTSEALTGDEAAERVSFDLTFRRSPEPRVFEPVGIDGCRLDCADEAGKTASGYWSHDWNLEWDVPAEFWMWVRSFFGAAVAEAMHEALEWFKVDGETFLDPHGPAEVFFYGLVDEFAEKLWNLRDTAQRS